MSRIVRIILILAAALIAIGAALFFAKGDDIKRLATVNTLFDADKIVDNFSNMDRAFLTHDLTVPIEMTGQWRRPRFRRLSILPGPSEF